MDRSDVRGTEKLRDAKAARVARAARNTRSNAYLQRVAVAASHYAATKLPNQNLTMMPAPTATWLRDDDGALF
ncbi:hypothetical protein ABH945_006497 [Paraburkholderia sp. GAS333]